jgi:4'-phosphopantetheinyl transferase
MLKEAVTRCRTESMADPLFSWPVLNPDFDQSQDRRSGPPQFQLTLPGPKQVHVWAASLDVPPLLLSAFEDLLCPAERLRAGRFHFAEHRNRYVAAHGWLRRLLGGYLAIPAAEVEFQFGVRAKPALDGSGICSNLQFNMSHCEAVALVAVAYGTPVGIDLERVRPLQDADDLVERFFSKRENPEFKLLAEEHKPMAFFNLWTRKEAWLKASGEGIAHLLSEVEVSFLPGTTAQLLSVPKDFQPVSRWTLRELIPGPGWVGAVVVDGPCDELECRCWGHECVGI